MDVKKAIDIVSKEYPGMIPIGYWEIDDVIIINTKPLKMFKKITQPSQFVVTNDGKVYGTNPMMYDISLATMKKLK